ncbi:MAG: hypothetical protein D6702_03320 [Planctomycetota bacterium]|nr:MAG: hypothetical protein D6702_03320 [Planctomycetota bacterium]
MNGEAWRDLGREVGGAWWFLEKLADDARPIQDLARLASGRDPVALLARRLLALEEGGPAAEALIERAAARLRALADRAEPWGRLPEEDRAFDPVVLLRRAGLRVLDEILARQQEEVER